MSREAYNILRDVKHQYPMRDDVSVAHIAACDTEIIKAYGTNVRVRVVNEKTGYERTGTVSRTTGWSPALLLMHRSNDNGSSDVLGPDDRIVAVKRGKSYVSAKGIYE